MSTNNFREKKFGVYKKGAAQSRLDRIREEQKLARKVEDKLHSFSRRTNSANNANSSSTSTSDLFYEKFLPDAKKVEFQGMKQRKRNSTADKRLAVIRKNGLKETLQFSRSEESNCLKSHSGIKSTEKCYREKSDLNDFVADDEPCHSSARKERFDRSGNAGKRLKRISKSPSDNSAKEKSVSHEKVPVTEKPTDNECMDVDMIDVSAISAAANVNSNSEELPKEWVIAREAKTSFFVDQIENLRKEPAYIALHEDHPPDVEMKLSVPYGDILIVIDTNILLSDLRFLNRLLETKNIGSYKSHVLVIPWLVVQEIDCLMKKEDTKLAKQARLANFFISDCLKKECPQFFGQSYDDFKVNFKNAVSVDNFIMQYCLKFIQLRNDVILLTNDRNLANKCMFSNVPVYTKEDFDKTFGISSAK